MSGNDDGNSTSGAGGGGNEEGGDGPLPPTNDDLDSDVGTVFSDDEVAGGSGRCKDVENDFDEDEGEGAVDEEGDDSSLSSESDDDGTEKCPICLQKFAAQEIGSPEMCEHNFCLRCISAWSKKVATCPIDRKFFSTIIVKKEINGEVIRIESVKFANAQANEGEYDPNPTYCEICGRCDREDRLLLCDGCDLGYHLECLEPPMEYVPIEDWFCPTCVSRGVHLDNEVQVIGEVTGTNSRQPPLRIPRTLENERILQAIEPTIPLEIMNAVEDVMASLVPHLHDRNQGPLPSSSSGTRTRRKKSTKRKSSTRTSRRGGADGIRRKRRSRRKTRRRRVAVDKRGHTARARLANHLGIMPPLPGQVYVGLPPACRSSTSTSSNSSSAASTSTNGIDRLRYSAGIPSLRLFGAANDLSDLVESWSDDEQGPVSHSVQSFPASRSHGAMLKSGPTISAVPSTSSATSTCDVLGGILKKQHIFLHDKNMKIARDGSLVSSINFPGISAVTQKSPPTSPTRSRPISSSPPTTATLANEPNTMITNHSVSVNQRNSPPSHSDRTSSTSLSFNTSHTSCGSTTNPRNSPTSQSLGNNESPGINDYNLSSYSRTEDSDPNPGDDEDFDIYSDIEEQPADANENDDAASVSPPPTYQTNVTDIAPKLPSRSSRNNSQDSKSGAGDDTDNEMIIDEEGTKSRSRSPEKQCDALTRRPSTATAETETLSHQNQDSATSFCDPVTSIEDIPLPDDTPAAVNVSNTNDKKDDEKVEESKQNEPKPNEQNDQEKIKLLQLKNSEDKLNTRKIPLNQNATTASSVHTTFLSDTGRSMRPTINFSLPKRHNLLPISSLMKKQRGVLKKDAKSDNTRINFQSEISKVFGGDSQARSKGESEENSQPKVSLIAEIFGSDDDDEGPTDNVIQDNSQASYASTAQVAEDAEKVSQSQNIDESVSVPEQGNTSNVLTSISNVDQSSSLWKAVVSEPVEEKSTNSQISKSDLKEKKDKNEQSNKKKTGSVGDKQGENEELEIIQIVNKPSRTVPGLVLNPQDVETISDSTEGNDSDVEIINEVHGHDTRKTRKATEETKLGRKRKHSGSSSDSNVSDDDENRDSGRTRRKKESGKSRKTKRYKSNSRGRESPLPGDNKYKSKKKNVQAGRDERSRFRRSLSMEETENAEESASWEKHSNRNRRHKDREERHRLSHSRQEIEMEYGDDSFRYRDERSYATSRYPDISPSKYSRSRYLDRESRRSQSPNVDFRPLSPHNRRRSLRHSRSKSRTPSTSAKKRQSRREEELSGRSSHSKKEKRRSHTSSRDSKSSKRYEDKLDALNRKIRKERHAAKSRKKAKDLLRKKEKRKLEKIFGEEMDVSKKTKPLREKGEKRKRRKEKSVSPVKAIMADGDSIVVSLNFQKDTKDSKSSSSDRSKSKKSSRKLIGENNNDDSNVVVTSKAPRIAPQLDLGTEDLSSNSESCGSMLESCDRVVGKGNEVATAKVSSSDGSAMKDVERESSFRRAANDGNSSERIFKSKTKEVSELFEDSVVTSTKDSLEPSGINEDEHYSRKTSILRGKSSQSGESKLTSQTVSSSAISPKGSGSSSASAIAAATTQDHSNNILEGSGGFANSSIKVTSSAGHGPDMNTISAITPTNRAEVASAQHNMRLSLPTSTPSTNMFNPVLATVASALLAVHTGPVGAPGTLGGMLGDHLRNRAAAAFPQLARMNKTNFPSSKGKDTHKGGGRDSPASPNSDDGEGLFEPPSDIHKSAKKTPTKRTMGVAPPPPTGRNMANIFDTLFGSEPNNQDRSKDSRSTPSKQKPMGRNQQRTVQKWEPKQQHQSFNQSAVNRACDINLNEELPASAVELSVQEKLLKKLNRQERVVEEVKLCLKPHFLKKHIGKDDYKEILRRAVPKICHSKTGEINPMKVRELIEAYVKKFRYGRKKPE